MILERGRDFPPRPAATPGLYTARAVEIAVFAARFA